MKTIIRLILTFAILAFTVQCDLGLDTWFLTMWDSSKTYSSGDMVKYYKEDSYGEYSGVILEAYQSMKGNNVNHDPRGNSTWWKDRGQANL